MAYIGKSPSGTGVRIRYYFTQTSGGATSISGTDDNNKTLSFSDGEYVDVYLNGVSLVAGTDYNTTTANTIGGLSALANGDVIEVVVYDIFTVADTVSQSSGGTFSGAVTVPQLNADNIRIDGNIISSTDTNGDITLDPNGTGDTIVASGKLGINTTSPSKVLDVRDNDATGTTTSSNRVALFATNGTGKDAHITFSNLVDSPASIGNKGALYFDYNGTERMRIDSSGNFMVGKSTAGSATAGFEAEGGGNGATLVTRSGSIPLILNRLTNDGYILEFRQDNSQEGAINVSGSTVTLVGGHLARWSQATDGNRIDGLVKGTVMTNLDQMAEWTKDGVTEENEQLNCMAVSSIEGDPNVAGVFQNWDDDDEIFTSDMIVAMTGDMVIRIASGTTVARGDLLMSAGDGTAKPQGDDIVRSKTIAKVTSTTVSHTYDDGSYLVPCVLMAC